MDAFGRTALVESLTVPTIRPRSDCARNEMLDPMLKKQNDIVEAMMNLCTGKSFGLNISLASSVCTWHFRSLTD
jgi:hypothetical protein